MRSAGRRRPPAAPAVHPVRRLEQPADHGRRRGHRPTAAWRGWPSPTAAWAARSGAAPIPRGGDGLPARHWEWSGPQAGRDLVLGPRRRLRPPRPGRSTGVCRAATDLQRREAAKRPAAGPLLAGGEPGRRMVAGQPAPTGRPAVGVCVGRALTWGAPVAGRGMLPDLAGPGGPASACPGLGTPRCCPGPVPWTVLPGG